MDDEKDNDQKTAAEPGDPKSQLMALLLALLQSTEDEATKGKIQDAIMLLSKGDDGPASITTPAEPAGEPTPGQTTARAAAVVRADPVMEKRLASLERRLDSGEATRLIEANRDLIPEASPALELWAIKQAPTNLSAWIRAQRATKPKPVAGGHQTQQRKQLATAGAESEGATFDPETVQLTASDRTVLKRTGGDPAAFLTAKRQTAARKAGVEWAPAKATN